MCARCQSDRSVPQTPFKNGVTNLKRINAQEYPGLVMLLLVALKGLLHDRDDVSWYEEIISVFWMMLSLNKMMSAPSFMSSNLAIMDARIKVFLAKYKEVFLHVALLNSKVGLKRSNSMPPNTVFVI
jgi:hypothetical protein